MGGDEGPRDPGMVVYVIFVLQGMGMLLPWNMFMNAKAYFDQYKLGKEYTGQSLYIAVQFINFVTFVSQLPNVAFNWLNIFLRFGGTPHRKIMLAMIVQAIIFLFTVVLAMMDTRHWPVVFFALTMISVFISNIATAYYQNNTFGVASILPGKYIGGVVIGQQLSGVLSSLIDISLSSIQTPFRTAGVYYFLIAIVFLCVCFDLYFALPLFDFYRHYALKALKESAKSDGSDKEKIPYKDIVKQIWPQLYNVSCNFFITLFQFPSILSNIKPVGDFPIKIYVGVCCFLTWNCGAACGSLFTFFLQWPKKETLWIYTTARFAYIPFYMFVNYQLTDRTRTFPVWLENYWIVWFVNFTHGWTNGHVAGLSMMYAPSMVEPKYAPYAGMIAGAALISGIFIGLTFSFIWSPLLTK